MAPVAATAERRHHPGTELTWAESWEFDFAAPDGSLGGYGRLALYPNLGAAWYWAALVGEGRRLVMVKDHDLDLPRGRHLEVRGQGIWSMMTCETPLEHWSVGLEAFALGLDDPMEAVRTERGDRVGLGFDLEWEAAAPADLLDGRDGYWQPCRVTGEILVGDERLDFDGAGCRDHMWGAQDWWSGPVEWASGVFGDGRAFAAAAAPVPADQLASAPLLLVAPHGRQRRLMRSFMAYHDAGGQDGYGWSQWAD